MSVLLPQTLGESGLFKGAAPCIRISTMCSGNDPTASRYSLPTTSTVWMSEQ